MKTVRQLLEAKGFDVLSVKPDTNVYDALLLMAEKKVGALLVLEADGSLAGIFSERDYAREVVITVRASPDRVTLTVENDGKKFVPPNGSKRMGLRIMQYRASLLGGKLSVTARPDQGTRVICAIPLA